MLLFVVPISHFPQRTNFKTLWQNDARSGLDETAEAEWICKATNGTMNISKTKCNEIEMMMKNKVKSYLWDSYQNVSNECAYIWMRIECEWMRSSANMTYRDWDLHNSEILMGYEHKLQRQF